MNHPPDKYRTPVGLLNRQVTIRHFVSAGADARGQARGDWEDLATVFANVLPLSGRWAEYARQLCETATYRVLVNYRSDVRAGMRVAVGDRLLVIETAIDQGEANHTLELLCTEARQQ